MNTRDSLSKTISKNKTLTKYFATDLNLWVSYFKKIIFRNNLNNNLRNQIAYQYR